MSSFKLRTLASGEDIDSPAHPTWRQGVWDCGAFRVTDPMASLYEAVRIEAPPARHITGLAFRSRFTPDEKVDLEIAALDNPQASLPERKQAAALRATMKDLEAAAYVDLDLDSARAGVQALEAVGLLATGRAAAILDAAVQDYERPS